MKTALKALFSTNPTLNFNSYCKRCGSLLKNFSDKGLVTEGTALHCHLLKQGIFSEKFVAIKLLIMYLDFRQLAEANQIVKEFNGFNLVVQNCLINANIQWGSLSEARKLFEEMPERNEVTWTMLISGLMKYGRVQESMWYFEMNPFKNVVSWTAGISGLLKHGLSFHGLKLFIRLLESGVKPNQVTFTAVISACIETGDFELGMSVLGLIVKTGFEANVSVCNSLITFCLRMREFDMARRVFNRMDTRDVVSWTAILDIYVEMGNLGEARRIFDEMPERNEISWSAIIARYSQSGDHLEASKLFRRMVQEGFKPTISCFSRILSTLASLENLRAGRNIHAHIKKIGIQGDVFISSSLVDLYCKCRDTENGRLVFNSIENKNVVSWNSMLGGYCMNGQMDEAKYLFDNMPTRNNVSWGAIIGGYVEHKQYDKVFEVFNVMLLSGESPTKQTFSSVLSACASVASLEKGRDIHGKILKQGFHYDVYLGTALTDMYAKSGDIESSKQVFDRMPERNEFSWTVMIQGLAESGLAKESLSLFGEMERSSSVAPNELMLLAVLFACSHCGLVDKGLEFFGEMESVYGVRPKGRHYTCVVDMLSRSGRLYEAEELINSMPFQPEANALAALLSGCKTYKNEEIAERTARKLGELAERNSAGFVLLSNIYASAGRWVDVSNVRKLMREKGLKKSGGCSWVEVRNHAYSFYSEDGTHSKSAEIYDILELLQSEMMAL
ncbi:putative ATP-dependent DNA helicase HFM1-like [Hibiscus syriacus]|uniref:ATP-dependent DNA helicase HFM1-like n=1 Tax=Hibiscus syriacus TaxID=106335 RepID=A0A6A3AZ07_HIBSY|nr:pentatricopeptide repeat-containing protein At2g13600-like [Hibiscus syriacus]KAE8710024.1 putative ATP-dependent DNA helicase HFM1-like [Hibiscus syriacus]